MNPVSNESKSQAAFFKRISNLTAPRITDDYDLVEVKPERKKSKFPTGSYAFSGQELSQSSEVISLEALSSVTVAYEELPAADDAQTQISNPEVVESYQAVDRIESLPLCRHDHGHDIPDFMFQYYLERGNWIQESVSGVPEITVWRSVANPRYYVAFHNGELQDRIAALTCMAYAEGLRPDVLCYYMRKLCLT